MAEAVTYPTSAYIHADTNDIFTQDRKNRYGGEIQAIEVELGPNPKSSTLYGTAANVATRLANLDALIATAANSASENLLVTQNAATPLTKVDVSADVLSIQGVIVTALTGTADLTVAGLNGLDTGARATNTWYSVWAGYSPSSQLKGLLLSTATARASLTLSHATLVGYTQWRRVGWMRADATGSGNFIPSIKQDRSVLYLSTLDVTFILQAGQSATLVAITSSIIQKYIPPGIRRALLDVAMKITANTTVSVASRAEVQFRIGGSSGSANTRAVGSWVTVGGTYQAQASTEQVEVPLGSSRDLDYKILIPTGGVNTDYSVDIAVAGYLDVV